PELTRRWKITNPNPFTLEAVWYVFNSNQKDTISVPPGVSYFVTQTIPYSTNTTFLLWKDDWMLTRLAVRYSSRVQCTGINNDADIVNGRGRQGNWEEVETEVPFITETWPTPAKEKFNILVSSPFEDAVEMELFNTSGERIKSLTAESNTVVEIDAKNYTSGMYILKVKQLIYAETIKLIKE
ncbi:MAG: T9SS type A sorting domain-containing protein, partial [Cyclobacteriaceae bacterium]|nr:T9SS type A sorting domain-containing protein [Cyclobacteriaceae bacterium]